MGRASRAKAERRAAPPPVGGGSNATQLIWMITGGVVSIIVVVVVILVATRSSGPKPPPAAAPSAADRNAPAALVKAADAVHFKPTTEPGVGEIEGKPASAGELVGTSTLLPIGATAPAFTLKTPLGKSYSLAAERGKAVLLEFFATWCPHCNAEAPHLAKLMRSLPAKRYAALSVNGDGEDAASVFAFDRYYAPPYPALLDPSSSPGSFAKPGTAGAVSTKYGEESFPTFYVIDPQGKVAWRSAGEQPDALLRQQLMRAAAQS